MADNEEEYPTEATIGDQRLRGPAEVDQDLLRISKAELHEQIARAAYEIYIRRGKVPGHALEDWLAAERLVLLYGALNGETFDGQET